MTHKPPVPAASQSPYPLHPTPVEQQVGPRRPVRVRPARAPRQPAATAHSHIWTIGVGLAAMAVAVLFLRRR